jgi:hypothetical protein
MAFGLPSLKMAKKSFLRTFKGKIMTLVWIVTDEENPDLLEGFATRDEGLAFIVDNNGTKDTLCLRSLLIKGV